MNVSTSHGLPVGSVRRAFQAAQVHGSQAGFLVELHECLLPGGGSGLEVSGDAVPEVLVVSDGLAPFEQGDTAVVFEDDSHNFLRDSGRLRGGQSRDVGCMCDAHGFFFCGCSG